MTKLFKGVLATMLSVGFLAGCGGTPAVTHTVTFWKDTVGGFYAEVEVEHGKTVEMPADPTRDGYDFLGWFEDTAFAVEFDEATLIEEDLDLYGKWAKQYVPDTRTFHLIGNFANTAYESTWDTAATAYTNTHMTVADDQNLFTIEIEIGYMGKFKVKQPGEPWDAGQEYDFTDIPEGQVPEYVVEGDTRNVQVKDAGLFRVQVETDLGELYIERIGDAVGEGVTPTPDPNAIQHWGMVGSMTWSGWGGSPDLEPEYFADPGYHLFRAVYLNVDDAFKFRTDNAWGIELGWSSTAVLPDASFIVPEMDGEAPKSGGNLIVKTAGFYTITIQKVGEVNNLTVAPTNFVLRGTSLTTGWGADGTEPLALKSSAVVGDVMTYTFEKTGIALLAGEFKVKLAEVGPYSGWDCAFGDGAGNFVIAAAGNYTVTLVVTFNATTNMFEGTATCVPSIS